jgi:hypothetical protein
MSDRRSEQRAGTDRRDVPRPPLRLNIALLLLGVGLTLSAAAHRRGIDAEYEKTFARTAQNPSELNQITAQLADMDLAQGKIDEELERRLASIEDAKSRELYLSLDTTRKTLSLKSGNETVKTASVSIAVPAAALKGAFNVVGKKAGAGRRVVTLANDRVRFSFVASAADLRDFWDRIMPETRVYVF